MLEAIAAWNAKRDNPVSFLTQASLDIARDEDLLDRCREAGLTTLFVGVETVVITAGASAPEDVVQECIEYLQRRYGATIQEEWVREESVHFPLPRSLRKEEAAREF